jgi:hypothetical protein
VASGQSRIADPLGATSGGESGDRPGDRLADFANRRGLPVHDAAGHVDPAQAAKVRALKQASPSFIAMRQLAMRFRGILRSGGIDKLDKWLDEADRCSLPMIQRFARTVNHDLEAVRNPATERWSNGPVEGQINRLKTLKRAMYGRAGVELLRARQMPFS